MITIGKIYLIQLGLSSLAGLLYGIYKFDKDNYKFMYQRKPDGSVVIVDRQDKRLENINQLANNIFDYTIIGIGNGVLCSIPYTYYYYLINKHKLEFTS